MPISQLADNDGVSERAKTFVFSGEGHTLGNALRCILSSRDDVEFCGYTVPHPAEDKMTFRIQMKRGRAVDALKAGLEDLMNLCDHVTETFDKEMTRYKSENCNL